VFPVQGPGFDFADPRLPRWMARAHFYDLEKQWATFTAHLQRGCQAARVPFMAPDLPIGFVQREKEFDQLRSLLLDPERRDPVAITTALTGAGGFGKTTLAAALCHDDAILQAFDDGILWVTLGETPNLADALAKLYAGLTGERPSFKDAEDAATTLAEKLERKTCLIVIDDVWDPAHLRLFLRGGEGCARLITSRLLQVATDAQAKRLLVDEMSGQEAVAMLTGRLPEPPPDLTPFRVLAQALGEWPLLLRLAGSAMAELVALGAPVDQALASVREDLAEGGITSWDRSSESDRNAAVTQTLKASLKQFDSLEQELYQHLAVFPEDEPVPLEVAAELWGLAGGATRRLVMKLASASLLEFDLSQGRLRLHDVLRTWLVLSMGKEALQEAHAALIGRWGNLRDLAQARVPAYAWRWIGYHLREAGSLHQLDGLLQDLGWLQSKLHATGIAALETDFDYASDQPELGRLRRVLRNASHVLAPYPKQLPSQLLARLPSRVEENAVRNLRRQSRDWIEKDGGGLPLTETLLSSEALLRTFAHGTMVCTLAVFPDGRLASGSHNGAIRIWNPDTGDCKITLKDPAEWLRCLAVLTDDRLASGYWDGSIRIWNLETGICESTLKGTSQDLQCLAVLTDGRLAAGSEDGLIDVWNPITEILEDTLESHTPFGVSCLVSLADGRLISGYSIIQAWDLPEGSHQILDDTSCSDGFLAVLNDGRLATSSFGASIQIWNLDKRICETTLDVFSHQVIQRSAAAGGTAGG
jgi:hypothetical protein